MQYHTWTTKMSSTLSIDRATEVSGKSLYIEINLIVKQYSRNERSFVSPCTHMVVVKSTT